MDQDVIPLSEVRKDGHKPAPGYEITVKPEPEDAPLYRVVRRAALPGRVYEVGELVRYSGIPGSSLELVENPPHPAEPVQKRGPGRPRIDKSVI